MTIRIEYKVVGADVVGKMNRAGAVGRRAVSRQLNKEAQQIKTQASKNAPVLTGNLAASIRVEADDELTYTVAARAPYARFVHSTPGTDGTQAIPSNENPSGIKWFVNNWSRGEVGYQYLRKAYREQIKDIEQRIIEAIEKAVRDG